MCGRLFRCAGKRTRSFCGGLFPATPDSRIWDNHRRTNLLHRKTRRPDSGLTQISVRIWDKKAHLAKPPIRNYHSKKEAAGPCLFYETLPVRAAHEPPEAAGHAEHGVAAESAFELAVAVASFLAGAFGFESPGAL